MIKKQKTQSKLIIALTAVIILLVALSSTLTFAYFTAQNSGSRDGMEFGKMSFSDETLTLTADQNNAHTGGITADVDNLVPGCTVNMEGGISIDTTIAAFVRVKVEVTVKAYYDETAKMVDLNNEVESTANHFVDLTGVTPEATIANYNDQTKFAQVVFNKVWELINDPNNGANQVDSATWISYYDEEAGGTPKAGAGYLYLSRAVIASDTDLIKLDNLAIEFAAAEFGNAWQGAKISIAIKADAIQAEHLTGVAANATIGAGNVATLAALPVWTFDNGVNPPPSNP